MKKNRLPKSDALPEAQNQGGDLLQAEEKSALNLQDMNETDTSHLNASRISVTESAASALQLSKIDKAGTPEQPLSIEVADVLPVRKSFFETASSYLAMDEETEDLYPYPAERDPVPDSAVSEMDAQLEAEAVSLAEPSDDVIVKNRRWRLWPFGKLAAASANELSPVQLEYQSRNRALEKENKKKGRRVRLSFWLRRFWSRSLRKAFNRRILVLSLLIFSLASFVLLPHFYVNHVTVEGLQTLLAEDLLAASGLEPGQHMIKGLGGTLESYLRLRYHRAEEQLKEKFAYIEDVVIRPSFPYGLTISVQERVGVAYIKQEQMVVVVDREGVVLHIQEGAVEDLPLIEGVHDSFVEVGKPMNASLKQSITSTVLILSTIIDTDRLADDRWNFFSRIESILPVSIDSHFLKVRLPNEKFLTVKLGSVTEMKDNLYWLRSILKIGELDDLPEGLLDISGKQRIFIPAQHFKTHILENRPAGADLPLDKLSDKEGVSTDNEKMTDEQISPAKTENAGGGTTGTTTLNTGSTGSVESPTPVSNGQSTNSTRPTGGTGAENPTRTTKAPLEIDLPDFDAPKPFTSQHAGSVRP